MLKSDDLLANTVTVSKTFIIPAMMKTIVQLEKEFGRPLDQIPIDSPDWAELDFRAAQLFMVNLAHSGPEFANRAVTTVPGELRHNAMFKSKYWHIRRDICKVSWRDRTSTHHIVYVDITCKKLASLNEGIPDYYIGETTPEWIYVDSTNPRYKLGSRGFVTDVNISHYPLIRLVQWWQYKVIGTISDLRSQKIIESGTVFHAA